MHLLIKQQEKLHMSASIVAGCLTTQRVGNSMNERTQVKSHMRASIVKSALAN